MTALDFLAAATAPTRLDPLQLFLDADIVVQAVIAGLLVASVWVWAITACTTISASRKSCSGSSRVGAVAAARKSRAVIHYP